MLHLMWVCAAFVECFVPSEVEMCPWRWRSSEAERGSCAAIPSHFGQLINSPLETDPWYVNADWTANRPNDRRILARKNSHIMDTWRSGRTSWRRESNACVKPCVWTLSYRWADGKNKPLVKLRCWSDNGIAKLGQIGPVTRPNENLEKDGDPLEDGPRIKVFVLRAVVH